MFKCFYSAAAALVLTLVSALCAPVAMAQDFSKAAVVYFTTMSNVPDANPEYMGAVKRMALELGNQLNIPVMEIIAENPYGTSYKETAAIARKERETNAFPNLATTPDISKYDIVFVGYPIWFRAYPRPVATWIKSQNFTAKRVFLFTSYGESGWGSSLEEARTEMHGATVVPFMDLRGRELLKLTDRQIRRYFEKALNQIR